MLSATNNMKVSKPLTKIQKERDMNYSPSLTLQLHAFVPPVFFDCLGFCKDGDVIYESLIANYSCISTDLNSIFVENFA